MSALVNKVGNHIFPDEVNLKSEFDRGKYRVLSDNPADEWFYPLEPDMLGEYLVIEEMKNDQRRKVVERLWETGWEILPYRTGWFATLLYKDFGSKIDCEQIRPKQINELNALAWVMALHDILKLFCVEGLPDLVAGYLEEIEQLQKAGFDEKREIALVWAQGAFNLAKAYGEACELKKAVDYYERIESIRKDGYERDREITLVLVHGAYNLAKYYSEADELEKAVYYWERIEDLRVEGFMGDKEIAKLWTDGAYNLTAFYGNAGELKKASYYVEWIESLCGEEFGGDREITLVWAKGTVLCSNWFKEKGEVEKAALYRGKFEVVYERYGGDDEFEGLARMLDAE